VFGGVEAGGTKFHCVVGSGTGHVVDEIRIETREPDETLGEVIEFFRGIDVTIPLEAIGVGSFGPVDLDEQSDTYGHITSTPKSGWRDTDIVGRLRAAMDVPIGFDTDVAASALGEHRWGAGEGLSDMVYVTVGTGIGGASLVDGQVVHGALHPEMGHLFLPRRDDDGFAGTCPFHNDCLEGLASGVAIGSRWGEAASALAQDHPAWDLEAHYLALGLANVVLMLSPQRIVMGGGVMQQTQLFPMIRGKLQEVLNGYLTNREMTEAIDEFILPPALGHRSGLLGALTLAELAADT
jgi:fructokinase